MSVIIFCCWCAIGLTGVIFLFFFVMKLFQFNRDQIEVERLMGGLLKRLNRQGSTEALVILNEMTGPVANLLTQGILASDKANREPELIRNAIEKQARFTELPALEQYMHFLGTLAYLLPWGGVAAVFALLPGINGGDWRPFLLLSAAAVLLAILANAAYNYLQLRLNNILSDMENAAMALLECCGDKNSYAADNFRRQFIFSSRCHGHYPEAVPDNGGKGKWFGKFFPGRITVFLNISLLVVAIALIMIRDLDFVKRSTMNIDVPKVQAAKLELVDRKKILVIHPDGKCFCEDWTPKTLDDALDSLSKTNKDEVFVWASAAVKAEDLMKIFEKFKRVTFIVDDETPAHEIQVK